MADGDIVSTTNVKFAITAPAPAVVGPDVTQRAQPLYVGKKLEQAARFARARRARMRSDERRT